MGLFVIFVTKGLLVGHKHNILIFSRDVVNNCGILYEVKDELLSSSFVICPGSSASFFLIVPSIVIIFSRNNCPKLYDISKLSLESPNHYLYRTPHTLTTPISFWCGTCFFSCTELQFEFEDLLSHIVQILIKEFVGLLGIYYLKGHLPPNVTSCYVNRMPKTCFFFANGC